MDCCTNHITCLNIVSVRNFTSLASIIPIANKPKAKEIVRNAATLYRKATFTTLRILPGFYVSNKSDYVRTT